jgi:hypothetical protein
MRQLTRLSFLSEAKNLTFRHVAKFEILRLRLRMTWRHSLSRGKKDSRLSALERRRERHLQA